MEGNELSEDDKKILNELDFVHDEEESDEETVTDKISELLPKNLRTLNLIYLATNIALYKEEHDSFLVNPYDVQLYLDFYELRRIYYNDLFATQSSKIGQDICEYAYPFDNGTPIYPEEHNAHQKYAEMFFEKLAEEELDVEFFNMRRVHYALLKKTYGDLGGKKSKNPVERDLVEAMQKEIRAIFPAHDNGLTYALFLSIAHMHAGKDQTVFTGTGSREDKELLFDYLAFENFIRLYKTRRDFPQHIRNRLRLYLKELPLFEEHAPKQCDETLLAHHDCSTMVKGFIKNLMKEGLFAEFWRTIQYDLIDSNNDFEIEEYLATSSEELTTAGTLEKVQWIDPDLANDRIQGASSTSGSEGHRAYLRKLTSPATYLKPKLRLLTESIFDELLIDFPNFHEVIAFYKAQFRLSKLSGRDRITPVLLLGGPGIGKTHFAKSLAKKLNTGYTFIDISSASDAWILSGLHASWHSGKPGKIFTSMLNSPTASPVILFDEIEKAAKGDHDATTPLYQCLEETNAKQFVDEYVDFPVDLSRVIYIACANDLEGLSEPLQSRFRVFEIPAPTSEQHAYIMQSVFRDEIGNSPTFEPDLKFEILESLARYSIREGKVKISEAVGRALLEYSEQEIEEIKQFDMKIRIELRHFLIEGKIQKKKMGF